MHVLVVVFTRDTHSDNYLLTQEGRNLPVPHCRMGSEGWQIDPRLDFAGCPCFDKPAFGSTELAKFLAMLPNLESVELVGVCTDICVISNAMLIKCVLPEVPVTVDSACCAGVTPERHETALRAMEACQIRIV